MNNVDWEKLCRSQLKAVQILTNEIDKVNTKNKELIHELEISNNSIKTLLNEQEVLHDEIAQLKDLKQTNKELMNDNLKLNKDIISLKEQLDNALQLCNQLKDNTVKDEACIKQLQDRKHEVFKHLDKLRDENNQLKNKIVEYETKPVLTKQEIVIQLDLFNFVDNDKKKSYTVDPNHFNMCLSNRKLTKEQAQFAYDMISKGKLTISNLCKQFKCNSGTISSIMSCKSYKEIVRN